MYFLNIKKTILLITACIFITATAFTQKGYYLQFAIQPGLSSLSGDWSTRYQYFYPHEAESHIFEKSITFSFETTINGGYYFTDNLGVSIGLGYASQGQSYKDITSPHFYKNEISLSYLKIPIKLNFTLKPLESLSFSGFAGFYLGFLTGYNHTQIYEVSYNSPSVQASGTIIMEGKTYTESNGFTSKQYDLIEKPFKSTNFGLTLGAGVQQKLSDKLSLQLMLNYQLGFGDVKNVASQYSSGSQAINVYNPNDQNRLVSHKNSVLGLMIGISKRF